jgi:hypothetical protein
VKQLARLQALWANQVASVGAADMQTALTLVKNLRARLEADG